MAKPNGITVTTADPHELARTLFKAGKDNELPTWRTEEKGGTWFIHTADQWDGKARLRMSFPESKAVRFELKPPEGEQYDQDVRGVYLGRFAEMLINHFGDSITHIEVD